MKENHPEVHKISKIGVLRAAVLGANDGIISTSSVIVGIASSGLSEKEILMTTTAAVIAGAMSMAAGEYVSVSSQADIEQSDTRKETSELETQPALELIELEKIYTDRGLSQHLAKSVAKELTEENSLAAHLRDELGIIPKNKARPLQAALTSASTFTIGALFPTSIIFLFEPKSIPMAESIFTIIILLIMGAIAAKAGGANIIRGSLRVAFWGAAAMSFTGLIGLLFEKFQ
jgi:VIT1/CCC1 family predicted Fe2+/Mn2+ transporter